MKKAICLINLARSLIIITVNKLTDQIFGLFGSVLVFCHKLNKSSVPTYMLAKVLTNATVGSDWFLYHKS